MNIGLYRGVTTMASSERRIDAIAANLANLGSTAFKRTSAVEHAVRRSPNATETEVKTSFRVDWTQGPIERTGVTSDFALHGDGFFAVEGGSGEVYTRDGNFHVTERGDLVTQQGFAVGWDGPRGRLDPVGNPMRVDASGHIWQGTRSVGRLKLVDFDARDRLRIDENGFYAAPTTMTPIAAAPDVHQGALEGANASAVDELVELIQTQRAFESGTNIMSMISQTLQRLSNFR